MPRAQVILWAPFGFRASEIAELLDAECSSITVFYGPRYLAPVRYLALFFRTMLLLARKRPVVVVAQNPAVFCPLTCLFYCRLTGARLVIDHHSIWSVKTLSGRSPLARGIAFLERFVSRSAYGNTAPHALWGRMLRRMGARNVLVYHDYVPRNERKSDPALKQAIGRSPVVAISSHGGHPLERIEVEAEAAGKEEPSGLSLVISGPEPKLEPRLAKAGLPPNVRYAGFLEREVYETLKASADFAINVTDEPYTLSHVLFEFVASSLPVISSKESAAQEVFGGALLYTDSDVESVCKAIERLLDPKERERWAAKVRRRQEELTREHEEEVGALRQLVLG